MSSPRVAQKPLASKPRRARIVLRDGASIEGGFYLNDGQALAPYLASRKGGWVNIVAAQWANEKEVHNHAVLQADQVLFASSRDGEIPVHNPTTCATPRDVDIGLDDTTRITGALHLGTKQRLSDYLSGCGKFLPVFGAKRLPSGEALGDIALNAQCVKVIRSSNVVAEGAGSGLEPMGLRLTGAMPAMTRDVVARDSGAIEVITEGRSPDRRKGLSSPRWEVAIDVPEQAPLKLTSEQAKVANWLSRHWLVQIGAQAQLDPPDIRELTATPSLEDVWRALAKRNDMSDPELAVHVAWVFMLPVANLDDASPDALQLVPAPLARKLGVLPLRIDGEFLDIAVSDPSSTEIDQQIGRLTKYTLRRAVTNPTEMRVALDKYYGPSAAPARG
jgi:type II secretion system (T2SS) protein E